MQHVSPTGISKPELWILCYSYPLGLGVEQAGSDLTVKAHFLTVKAHALPGFPFQS